MRQILDDLRLALRILAKSPILTGAALLSLALAIGANAAIFTVVNAVFFEALPFHEADRLVTVFITEEDSEVGSFLRISHPTFEDVRDQLDVFSEVAVIAPAPAVLVGPGGEPERVAGQMASANFLDLLGVEPNLGRGFRPEEDIPGSSPVVVLNHRFWKERLGGDPGILGRTVTLNGHPFTVIGVSPEGFHGTLMLIDPDFWAPLAMHDVLMPGERRSWLDSRRALFGRAYARLRPGVSRQQAEEALAALGHNLAAEHPVDSGRRGLSLLSISEAAVSPEQRETFTRAATLLLTVVGLVLLIACANVANLLLARALSRRREIAVRLALGASRGRLIRQLMTESLVLALGAGGLGLLLARWGRSALWNLRPPFLEHSPLDLTFDARVIFFTLGLSILTGILFGLAPALQATRPEMVTDLKQESLRQRSRGRLPAFRELLVAGQVALSLVALIGTALFLRSLGKATEVDLGFESEALASLNLDLAPLELDPSRGLLFYDELLERVRALPAVEAASLAATLPLANTPQRRTVQIEGRAEPGGGDGAGQLSPVNVVTPGYFRTTGIRLLEGRDFEPLDQVDSPRVAVISRQAATAFWPDEAALGRRFRLFGMDADWTVVGVVEDSKLEEVGEAPQPQIYLPLRQLYLPSLRLLVQARGEPQTALASARDEVRALAPAVPMDELRLMRENVQRSLWGARMAAVLLGALGLLALLLAAVGLYGVASYSVFLQRHEIGIRMALGSQPAAVRGLILRQGLRTALLGVGLGLLLAVPLARMAKSLLFGLSPVDPLSFAATAGILITVAALANLLPAWRATAVNPVAVLSRER